jgi:signal transduction histidine kinase
VLLEPESGDWRLRAARNYSQETLQSKDMEVSRTVIESVLSAGQGLVTTDAQTDPRFATQDSVIFYALRSILCAPLLLYGQAIGAIYVDNRAQTGLFTPSDLELLDAFAAQAAVAIELETLAQIDRELNNSLEMDHVTATARKWAAQISRAENVWVYLVSNETAAAGPRLPLASGVPAQGSGEPDPGQVPGPPLQLARQAVQTGEIAVSPAGSTPAYVAVPLLHGARTLGALLVEREQPFAPSEIEFLNRLAGRSAGAFENARLYLAVQEADQAKTKFVSVVTHELRIPMTSIKGYTDLLRQGAVGPVNEMQANFLNVIRNNVERMNALVSDLADISRIETGRLKIDNKAISIHEHVDEVVRSLQPKLKEKKQNLKLELPADLPEVFADPNRVVQVMTNLLSNAWKYTPEEGWIVLSASAENDRLRIEVADNGIGISSEDQELLFGQFFRSEDPKVREQQGWGLGLNVTKRLVEIMGGDIGCRSQVGQGSTFWFTLPLA